MKVLIPSDNRDFVLHWVKAYTKAGCEVVTGTFNFDLRSANFDLVHYQWPEELCQWLPPSDQRLRQITTQVKWWESQCPSIVTVNNIYPHGYERNDSFKKLYDAFFQHCTLVLHFSPTSKKLVFQEFPSAQHDRHIITTPFNYDGLVQLQKSRGPCRQEFGYQPNDFVILILGAIRSWDEIRLITKAFSNCRIPDKRLLMAGRYCQPGSRLRRKWRQMLWRVWLWSHRTVVVEDYIPDEHLYRFFDTADVVVVPRLHDLSSGIPSLAMTFGTLVVAPSHGAFPDYLAGSDNLLYASGDPLSLAKAIETAATLNRKEITIRNREIVKQWTWEKIVSDCLQAVGQRCPVPFALR